MIKHFGGYLVMYVFYTSRWNKNLIHIYSTKKCISCNLFIVIFLNCWISWHNKNRVVYCIYVFVLSIHLPMLLTLILFKINWFIYVKHFQHGFYLNSAAIQPLLNCIYKMTISQSNYEKFSLLFCMSWWRVTSNEAFQIQFLCC